MKITTVATLECSLCTGFYAGDTSNPQFEDYCEIPIVEGCLKIGDYFLSVATLKELTKTLEDYNSK
ncbi:hypothetical protein S140_223 [Shewanella sp. phage 1/40]|uniref:hypothetical protein n=1 Tax=Shewanella sp. phage 1/40 TaxID=1458860 RepID=UPI0004F690E3|nr:hypothetical protein S140_223 [Shewanella sp. phage 1/40]AHK11630.1 hypothetical protein S140_223 [Shewanella sp. phage 1/40]